MLNARCGLFLGYTIHNHSDLIVEFHILLQEVVELLEGNIIERIAQTGE